MDFCLLILNHKKYHLNMNPAYSASLCVNEWRRYADAFICLIYIEACVMLAVFSASATLIYEYINT